MQYGQEHQAKLSTGLLTEFVDNFELEIDQKHKVSGGFTETVHKPLRVV